MGAWWWEWKKHVRYSNHMTFLARCRAQGIIPNGLNVSLPVRSARANNIAHKTSQALLWEWIADARRQKALASLRISDLESNLSQSLNSEQWTCLDEFCKDSVSLVHRSVKERQTLKLPYRKHKACFCKNHNNLRCRPVPLAAFLWTR